MDIDYKSLVKTHIPGEVEDDVIASIVEHVAEFHKFILTKLQGPADSTITLDDDDVTTSYYMGNILSWVPSGKLYAFWTTNQTELDELKDVTFWSVMEELVPDVWFESGEGNGCDLFMYQAVGGDT